MIPDPSPSPDPHSPDPHFFLERDDKGQDFVRYGPNHRLPLPASPSADTDFVIKAEQEQKLEKFCRDTIDSLAQEMFSRQKTPFQVAASVLELEEMRRHALEFPREAPPVLTRVATLFTSFFAEPPPTFEEKKNQCFGSEFKAAERQFRRLVELLPQKVRVPPELRECARLLGLKQPVNFLEKPNDQPDVINLFELLPEQSRNSNSLKDCIAALRGLDTSEAEFFIKNVPACNAESRAALLRAAAPLGHRSAFLCLEPFLRGITDGPSQAAVVEALIKVVVPLLNGVGAYKNQDLKIAEKVLRLVEGITDGSARADIILALEPLIHPAKREDLFEAALARISGITPLLNGITEGTVRAEIIRAAALLLKSTSHDRDRPDYIERLIDSVQNILRGVTDGRVRAEIIRELAPLVSGTSYSFVQSNIIAGVSHFVQGIIDGPARAEIIRAAAPLLGIAINMKDSVQLQLFGNLLSGFTDGRVRAAMIRAIASVPVGEDRIVLITHAESTLHDMPPGPERAEIFKEAVPLLEGVTDRSSLTNIVKEVRSLPSAERAAITRAAAPALKTVPLARADVIFLLGLLSTESRNRVSLGECIDFVQASLDPAGSRPQAQMMTLLRTLPAGSGILDVHSLNTESGMGQIKELFLSYHSRAIQEESDKAKALRSAQLIRDNAAALGLSDEDQRFIAALICIADANSTDRTNPYVVHGKLAANAKKGLLPFTTPVDGVLISTEAIALNVSPRLTSVRALKEAIGDPLPTLEQMGSLYTALVSKRPAVEALTILTAPLEGYRNLCIDTDDPNKPKLDPAVAGLFGELAVADPNAPVSNTAVQFATIMKHIFSLEGTADKDKLSVREETFLTLIEAMRECATGKTDAIMNCYNALVRQGTVSGASVRNKNAPRLHKLVEETLNECFTDGLVRKICGMVEGAPVDQGVHQTQFIRNLSARVGLDRGLNFDRHAGLILPQLLDLLDDEEKMKGAIDTLGKHFTQLLLKKLHQALNVQFLAYQYVSVHLEGAKELVKNLEEADPRKKKVEALSQEMRGLERQIEPLQSATEPSEQLAQLRQTYREKMLERDTLSAQIREDAKTNPELQKAIAEQEEYEGALGASIKELTGYGWTPKEKIGAIPEEAVALLQSAGYIVR